MSKSIEPVTGRWYGTLKEGLFKSIPQSNLVNYCTVYKISGPEEGQRRFATFRSHTEFYLFYKEKPDDIREYHEYILGQFRQKFRYDVDLEVDKLPEEYKERYGDDGLKKYGDEVRDRLLRKTVDHLKEKYDIKTDVEKDFLVCISHDVLCRHKYSCHIILHSFCVARYEMAKQLFEEIVLTDDVLKKNVERGIIDSSVYASMKSFRFLGSGKRHVKKESGTYVVLRHKRILYEYDFEGKKVKIEYPKTSQKEIYQFRQTCISDTVHCGLINVDVPEKKVYNGEGNYKVSNRGDISAILNKETGGAFEILKIENNLVSCKRLNPSYCKLCEREHEHENIFLTIRADGGVFYHCYRKNDGNRSGTKGSYQIGEVRVEIKVPPKTTLLPNMTVPEGEEGKYETNDDYEQSKGSVGQGMGISALYTRSTYNNDVFDSLRGKSLPEKKRKSPEKEDYCDDCKQKMKKKLKRGEKRHKLCSECEKFKESKKKKCEAYAPTEISGSKFSSFF